MKVLHIITKSNWGGAQKHVFDVCSRLKENNYDVYVACGVESDDAPLKTKLESAGMKVYKIKSLNRDIKILGDIKSFFEIQKIIRSLKPDVVHLHSSKIGALGALASRTCGVKKIIFTAHGAVFEEDRNILSKYILKFLTYVTVLLCHKVICVSQKDYDVYPKLFVSPKLVVIKNGLLAPAFLDQFVAREKLNIKIEEDEIIIGTIAELHKNKGYIYLLEAAKILNLKRVKFQMHLLGGGELHAELSQYIIRNKLDEVVFMHGFTREASSYLKAFDLFILPSIKEGLPYAVLEAGLAESPVISTNVGGIPEIITDGETGLLVNPKDSSAIAAAIEKLKNDAGLRTTLAQNLNKKIRSEYGIEEMLRKIEALYVLGK